MIVRHHRAETALFLRTIMTSLSTLVVLTPFLLPGMELPHQNGLLVPVLPRVQVVARAEGAG
jgi:hypothetical protein